VLAALRAAFVFFWQPTVGWATAAIFLILAGSSYWVMRAERASRLHAESELVLNRQVVRLTTDHDLWSAGSIQPQAVQVFTAIRAVASRGNLNSSEFYHHFVRALRSLVENRPGDALEQLQQAQAAYAGDDPLIHKAVGASYRVLGSHRLSSLAYEASIRKNPGEHQIHNYLGFEYYLQGRIAEAEKEFRTALDLEPGYYKALYNLALCQLANGDREGFRKSMEQARQMATAETRTHPRCAKAHFTLSLIDKRLNRLPEALASLKTAVRLGEEFRFWAPNEDAFQDIKGTDEFKMTIGTLDPAKVVSAWDSEGVNIFSDECTH
jgi:tetratricopeptide (TPR) repeat protein